MNARDTLRALADGKTIIGDNGYLWRIDEYDELVYRKPKKFEKGKVYESIRRRRATTGRSRA